jgi:DNA gyrase subunit A
VIRIIRGSETTDEAGERLRERFALSERQSDAILNMRLAKLTGLEIEQLEAELTEVRATIADLRGTSSRAWSADTRSSRTSSRRSPTSTATTDGRRSSATGTFSIEDLIPDEEMVITVSIPATSSGCRWTPTGCRAAGGRGIAGMGTKEEDWVEHLFLASTHDYLMFFTRKGQCYWLKVHEIPPGQRASRGKPIVNLINVPAKDGIAALVPVREFSPDRYLMFATRQGVVKKTVLSAYGNPRVTGINAINRAERRADRRPAHRRTQSEVVLATREGMAIRFKERTFGRWARDDRRSRNHPAGQGLRDRNGRPEGWRHAARRLREGNGQADGGRTTTGSSGAGERASSTSARPRRPGRWYRSSGWFPGTS